MEIERLHFYALIVVYPLKASSTVHRHGGGDSAFEIKPVLLRAFRTTKVIFMTQTFIPGKDAALEDSIARFQQKLSDLGFQIEEASWLNPVPNVWSVHIRDKECALCFTNGKGATKKAALASALGEYFERLSTNYFFADFWLGETIANKCHLCIIPTKNGSH
ncbi:YcaO-like family protein [Escherichia coli]